jgi:tryptophan-rich sensory protein
MTRSFKLIISIGAPLFVGAIAGYFTSKEIRNWYFQLNKPWWNPPNWLFGPVWTTLYILMGIALFLVWKKEPTDYSKRQAVNLFWIQLLLNFLWSFIFFRYHQPGWALVEIVAMWAAIMMTILTFSKINKLAAWLLVPYISWVSFATILNYTIWQLN